MSAVFLVEAGVSVGSPNPTLSEWFAMTEPVVVPEDATHATIHTVVTHTGSDDVTDFPMVTAWRCYLSGNEGDLGGPHAYGIVRRQTLRHVDDHPDYIGVDLLNVAPLQGLSCRFGLQSATIDGNGSVATDGGSDKTFLIEFHTSSPA